MYPLIAIAAALALLVILLRVRVRIGRSMFAAAVALAVLLRVGPLSAWQQVCSEWTGRPFTQTTGYLFVTLTVLLMMVNLLGAVMKEVGVSERILPALHGLFRSRRAALAAIPMLMGLLPTPGGIMLSAPLVREPGDQIGVSRVRLAAINLFFRHQWEPVWPLFPAVPLIQGMFDVSPRALIGHNLVLTGAGIIGGVVFLLFSAIPRRDGGSRRSRAAAVPRHVRDCAGAFWPIALTAALYAAVKLPPALGIMLSTLVFIIVHRLPWRRFVGLLRATARPDIALLILGALLFKLILETAQAVPEVVAFLRASHVPVCVLLFLLPLLVAFLTGLTMPTVAITFPILMEFIGTGAEARLGLESLAFAGIIVGLLITPVHLCVALSTGYFDVPFGKIVGQLVGPLLCITAAGIFMALVFG